MLDAPKTNPWFDCTKCGGSGQFRTYGRCSECKGKGGFSTSPEARAKAAERARIRKHIANRQANEATGLVPYVRAKARVTFGTALAAMLDHEEGRAWSVKQIEALRGARRADRENSLEQRRSERREVIEDRVP